MVITKHHYISVTNASIRARHATGICEVCGKKTDEPMEVHLIPSIKTLQGEELWKQIMRNKRRKTLVVCSDCHRTIHE